MQLPKGLKQSDTSNAQTDRYTQRWVQVSNHENALDRLSRTVSYVGGREMGGGPQFETESQFESNL